MRVEMNRGDSSKSQSATPFSSASETDKDSADNSWAMLSTFYFKTSLRHSLFETMLDTFGTAASERHPLHIADGCPLPIAERNRQSAGERSHVRYHHNPTESGIRRLYEAVESIADRYIVTVPDDFSLVGPPETFLSDVRHRIGLMERHPQIDVFLFYGAQLGQSENKELVFFHPAIATQLKVEDYPITLSVSPKFLYNIAIHPRDRLIRALEYVLALGHNSFWDAERTLGRGAIVSRLLKWPTIAALLWNSAPTRKILGPSELYRMVVMGPQHSLPFHLGEVESGRQDCSEGSEPLSRVRLRQLATESSSLAPFLKTVPVLQGNERALFVC